MSFVDYFAKQLTQSEGQSLRRFYDVLFEETAEEEIFDLEIRSLKNEKFDLKQVASVL